MDNAHCPCDLTPTHWTFEMRTTVLFVELIIIGVGTVLWIILIMVTVLGYTWIPYEKMAALPTIIPGLAFTYVLGILTDRCADRAFRRWDRSLRSKRFGKTEDYQRARTVIYGLSDSLREWFHYGRSRLRICRGWAFNSILIISSLNSFIWIRVPVNDHKVALSLFLSFMLVILATISCWAWYRLTSSEYRRLSQEYSEYRRLSQEYSVQREANGTK